MQLDALPSLDDDGPAVRDEARQTGHVPEDMSRASSKKMKFPLRASSAKKILPLTFVFFSLLVTHHTGRKK